MLTIIGVMFVERAGNGSTRTCLCGVQHFPMT
jgi:hypothetical protein